METENHEYYVSLEVAKLLKEAGFDWSTRYSYDLYLYSTEGEMRVIDDFASICNEHNTLASMSTLDVAQRWLREIKHLDISIHYDPTIKSQPYVYFIYDVEEKFNDILGIISPVTHSYSDGYFYTYEEAQEAGIKKALEIILEKGE